jgi:thiamine-phosphate pyrophosphorylase
MKLLLVSNFTDIHHEQYVLNLLFCEGLQHFHLRKANYSIRQMATYIERIPEPFRDRIVLHSHFELIDEFGLRGAHFTKKHTYEAFLSSRGHDGLLAQTPAFDHLSFSVHSIPDIKRVSPMYDYVFLSPVFDSISNQGYNSKFKIHDLKTFLTQSSLPPNGAATERPRPQVIALGGINETVVDQVFDTGFDGMALLGYIWTGFEQDGDMVLAVKRFRYIKNLIHERERLLARPVASLS